MSKSLAEHNKAFMVSYLIQLTPVTSAEGFTTSTVQGTTPFDQLRRGFLYYTECERFYKVRH